MFEKNKFLSLRHDMILKWYTKSMNLKIRTLIILKKFKNVEENNGSEHV